MRASRDTSVISAITNPAPPIARLPRCTRCQSPINPSSATYWHIGDTTSGFGSTRSPSRNGVNMGGGTGEVRLKADAPYGSYEVRVKVDATYGSYGVSGFSRTS